MPDKNEFLIRLSSILPLLLAQNRNRERTLSIRFQCWEISHRRDVPPVIVLYTVDRLRCSMAVEIFCNVQIHGVYVSLAGSSASPAC